MGWGVLLGIIAIGNAWNRNTRDINIWKLHDEHKIKSPP